MSIHYYGSRTPLCDNNNGNNINNNSCFYLSVVDHLIAAVGQKTINNTLVKCDAIFCAVTSRPLRPGEVNGEQYTFVTRAEMEKDILNKR